MPDEEKKKKKKKFSFLALLGMDSKKKEPTIGGAVNSISKRKKALEEIK